MMGNWTLVYDLIGGGDMYLTPRSNMINIESLIGPVEMRLEIHIFIKSTANPFLEG